MTFWDDKFIMALSYRIAAQLAHFFLGDADKGMKLMEVSNAYISEYATLGSTSNGGPAQIASLPAIIDQKIDFSGGATSSAAFNAATKFIRIHCDAACSFVDIIGWEHHYGVDYLHWLIFHP